MPQSSSHPRAYLEERIGRLSQIGGISAFTHAEGKGKGVETVRVRTERGLEFWVVPDRGMDIMEATFRGVSLAWHSPTGVMHPSYYSSKGLDWRNSFGGGLLCTCGLTTAGAPSEDQGESFGLHGPIGNTPAEQVNWSESWQEDDCVFTVSGKVRETFVFGPNLLMERKISTSLRSASLAIHDTVENQGITESPLMLIYHFNFGFPLLTERSQIFAPSKSPVPFNEFSKQSEERWNQFEEPQRGIDERGYFHAMKPEADGKVTVVLVSDRDKLDFGVALTYDSSTLPEFVEWKMSGTNHFVLGLEPANCRSQGRKAERERGTLQTIAPGERREFRVELRVLEGADEVAEAIRLSTASLG